MTDPLNTAAIRAHIEAAHEMVAALCSGQPWTMRVPANEDRDSDLVISRALTDAETLLARIAELEVEQQNGIWGTHVGHISRYGHFLPNPENPTHERRVWFGPVTPISDPGAHQ